MEERCGEMDFSLEEGEGEGEGEAGKCDNVPVSGKSPRPNR